MIIKGWILVQHEKARRGGFIIVMKRIWVDISTHISFYNNGAKC